MFGTVDPWFYRVLAGIKCLEPGWKKILIYPHLVGDLKYVNASVNTLKGPIEVSWERREGLVIFTISIPVGSEAEFRLPKLYSCFTISEDSKIIWEGGTFYREIPGISEAKESEKYISFTIGSGYYSFKLIQK
jgi:alpha-L-rhamnosidase